MNAFSIILILVGYMGLLFLIAFYAERRAARGRSLVNISKGLMIEGLTNPEIAARLTVSRSTAKAHVSHILSKLGASTRMEAISLALQHKLVIDEKEKLMRENVKNKGDKNVFIFVFDTLSAEHMSLYGYQICLLEVLVQYSS